MIEQPTDENGLPKASICAVCEEEFEDGDTIVQIREGTVGINDNGAFSIEYTVQFHPELHKKCFQEL